MAVYFVFIDGLGIGPDSDLNPLYTEHFSFFEEMAGQSRLTESANEIIGNNVVYKPIDATLGVEGLPQSGTGQVSLFTGMNAAELAGKHFGPYPHSATKDVLSTRSVVAQLLAKGRSFRFMNAYPPIFFRLSGQRDRWSTTTLMCRQHSMPLHTADDVLNGNGITAEITQEVWRERLGIELPTITESTAAARMIAAGRKADVVLYEYYLTDKAGHAMDLGMAKTAIGRVDAFLGALADGLTSDDLLLVSSDHGNVEDLGTKSHTMNPVPLIAYGNGAEMFAEATSIMDVVPTIMRLVD